jgi:hypothetical protein
MKLTFTEKTFTARSFRCATLTGTPMLGPYRVAKAQMAGSGAAAGQDFHTGATIGQHYCTGATTGLCNA